MNARRLDGGGGTNHASIQAAKLRLRLLELVEAGESLLDARTTLSISEGQYEKWRKRFPEFRTLVDDARRRLVRFEAATWEGDTASFVRHYFHMEPADFQLDWYDAVEHLRLGDILMALWPPGTGKTTSFENLCNKVLAVKPETRFTVGARAAKLSRKVLNRIRNRMEPDGPSPAYVKDWGPFVPQFGMGRKPNQPWGDEYFNVYKKSVHDERDYSVQAIGRDSSVLSTRCDHLHIDDIQDVKTLGLTDQIIDIIRQDWLSRPGEEGITTIAGNPIADRDVLSELEDDADLVGILHVKKYPMIVTDQITGEQRPLLPHKHTMENIERIAARAGPARWARNYMMDRTGGGVDRVFDEEAIEASKDNQMSLTAHHAPTGAPIYVTLDPALGGWNCVMAMEVTADKKLVIREIREVNGLRSNEQIMEQLGMTIMRQRGFGCHVTDVVIEEMNFQKGLLHDERLQKLKTEYGFALRGHLTGWNKYDEDVGLPSMATNLRAGDLVLPYADDPTTRREVDELIRQMRRWKQGLRGNKVRMDRLMALWFGWILWQNRYKRPSEHQEAEKWKRAALPFKRTDAGLIVPSNYKVVA